MLQKGLVYEDVLHLKWECCLSLQLYTVCSLWYQITPSHPHFTPVYLSFDSSRDKMIHSHSPNLVRQDLKCMSPSEGA